MNIEIRDITKIYGAVRVLKDVSLDVPSGHLVALLGPSGSGKTTLLRILAGLEAPDHGHVLYQNDDVTRRSVRERNVGFVFQHYALFNHMSIFENIAFGLRVRRWPEEKIKGRVDELIGLIQLKGLEKRHPAQLSGGQRQRVALARALAPEPQMLLLDEPFGALDAKVRQELRRWLRKLHDETHITSVFVTHDQEEAFEVADKVAVMNKGRIEQYGTPEEIFAHPANDFVLDFLGGVNVFHGRISNGLAKLGDFEVPYPAYPSAEPQAATAYIRAHELDIDRRPSGEGSFPARIVRVRRTGSSVKVGLETSSNGAPVDAELSNERYDQLDLAADEEVFILPRQVRVFPRAQTNGDAVGVAIGGNSA